MTAGSVCNPQHLFATIFHVWGIDPKIQFLNQEGRPVCIVDGEGGGGIGVGSPQEAPLRAICS